MQMVMYKEKKEEKKEKDSSREFVLSQLCCLHNNPLHLDLPRDAPPEEVAFSRSSGRFLPLPAPIRERSREQVLDAVLKIFNHSIQSKLERGVKCRKYHEPILGLSG